ncbi:ketopantoate reductase family protein [Streptosporangiaceae bacterium NEAU-GS5]|nr:ketopantoate reductase family protein [Streptosporangiaceae bacterium NEAU-GS5]
MRILVVGAGVIGTIYGWLLSEAGHQVTHLLRPGKAGRFVDGVSLDVLDKRKGYAGNLRLRYPVAVTEVIEDDYELVIVPTKPYQLIDALQRLAPEVRAGATYLLLTQNWAGTAAIDAVIPRDRYLFGDAQAGGTFIDGTLVCAIFPKIVLGRVDGGRDPALDRVAAIFADAGVRPVVPPDVLHFIWIQYAINAGLWPPMVRAGSLRGLLRDRALGTASLLAAAECLRVTAARGVDLDAFPETRLFLRTTSPLGRLVAAMAMRLLFRFGKAVNRTSAHALADPREITTAYHDLVTTGRRLGVAMPVMDGFEADVTAFAGLAAEK